MSQATEELSEGEEKEEDCKNACGLILGCWDQEKTDSLIQDLEHSVNLVERKCVQLFEELIHYKKYLEKSGEDFHHAVSKKKPKRSKNSHFYSGSEPDIAFRKNFVNFQAAQQAFEEKFQAKLCSINAELREAAHKIGLKDNIILLHAGDYLKAPNLQTEVEAESCDLQENITEEDFVTARTKSDPIVADYGGDAEFSKITRNELELYQKLSRLSMKRRKREKQSKGGKMKFCVKKTPRCRQDFLTCGSDTKKKKTRKKRKPKKFRRTTVHQRGSRSPRDSLSNSPRENESEIDRICKSLNEAINTKKLQKSGDSSKGQETAVEGSRNLGSAITKAVPFTACTSTSRSYNIGLNIQQLMFLSKQRKAGSKTHAAVDMNDNDQQESACKKTENDTEKGFAVLWTPDSKNVGFDNSSSNHAEHRRVWISQHNKSNFRKVRSKYTGRSPEGFLEYHKSTTSKYTNGRKSMIKSESKRAYAVGSRIMVSDCQRTDVFEVRRDKNSFENASGDCVFNKGYAKPNSEWTEVYSSFLDMHRKYTSLKEKLSDNHIAHAEEELDSLENEIDCSIGKYKHFLQFYSKFLQLNQHLKSLKCGCQSKSFGTEAASFSSNVHRKLCSYRPTHSTTMKRALREVQALQDKINLVSG